MNFARKAVLIIISPLFFVLLFTTAFDTGVIRVATHPATVKKIVADSGVYNNIIPSLLKQAGTVNSQTGSVVLTSPGVQSAAETTFRPQFLQTTTNNVIDSMYSWLDGKTAIPDFKIDLTSQKQQFAQLVAQAAGAQATSLPACTAPVDLSNYNVFTANCLPPGTTATDVSDGTLNTLLSGQGFLDNPVITADTLKASGSNQSVFQKQLKNLPATYRRIKETPLLLALLTLLLAVAIVFLSSTKRRGLKHVAITLLAAGLFLLLCAWGLSEGISKAVPKINFNNAAFDSNIRALVTDLAQSIDKNYWWFGGLYSALGIGGIIGVWYSGKELKPAAKKGSKITPPTEVK